MIMTVKNEKKIKWKIFECEEKAIVLIDINGQASSKIKETQEENWALKCSCEQSKK